MVQLNALYSVPFLQREALFGIFCLLLFTSSFKEANRKKRDLHILLKKRRGDTFL